MTIMSLEDWAKADVDEIRGRWEKRRIEIEEIERKIGRASCRERV